MGFLPTEKETVKTLVTVGKSFGYGNAIHRLQMAWVLDLKENGCPTWHSAALGALLNGYEAAKIGEHDDKDDRPLVKWLKEYTGQED